MERSSQPLVVGLATALGVALLAIAYLLGRASAPPAVVTVAPPAHRAAPALPAAEPAASSPTDLGPGASPASTTETPTFPIPARDTPFGPTTGPAPLPPTSAFTPPSPERQRVAAYFDQADRLADMGAGDPQAFAASMMQSVSSGDFSGFDDLLKKARDQRQQLQAIAPPRLCTEYHRLALKLSGDSVSMLEKLKAALMKGDSAALLAIATEGQTLEAQVAQLKDMGETVKRQAGL